METMNRDEIATKAMQALIPHFSYNSMTFKEKLYYTKQIAKRIQNS